MGHDRGERAQLRDVAPCSLQAMDWEAGASSRDAPSLPPSTASPCPGGINTRFLPLISSRGVEGRIRGGEGKKKTLWKEKLISCARRKR